MSWLHRLRSLRRNLFRRARAERELDAEVRSFLDLLAEEKMARGMRPDEARRAARIELGGIEQVKESVREARTSAGLETLGQDVRYGVRILWKNPGFAAVAVLTLALGIGANTVLFSVVDAVLLRPLPYPKAERLVALWSTDPSTPLSPSAPPDFREWKKESARFADLGAFAYSDQNLSGAGQEPERVQGARVSASLFPTLGMDAALGRVFLPGEEQFGRHREVLLSHGLWQRRFGGRPDIVGRSLELDGESYTVVGVMPAGMPFFDNVRPVDLWVPLSFAPEDNFNTRNNRFLEVVGRLQPHASLAQAQADLDLIARRIAAADPQNAGYGVRLVPLQEQVVGRVRPLLLVLFGAVGFVLLIACANVANLLLSRAAARQQELALRASLGAGRRRLFRQLLLENLPLGLLGGAGGVALAEGGQRLLLSSLLPADFPRFNAIGLNGGVLAFTLGVSLVAALAFGLAPACHALRRDGQLTAGSGARSPGAQRHRSRGLLVVMETALALVLLLGAGLLGKSFARLGQLDPGFSARQVLTLQVPLSPTRYPLPDRDHPSPARAMAFFDQLAERVAALPGVQAVGVGTQLPLGVGIGWGKSFYVAGRPLPSRLEDLPGVLFKLASPGFFQALGYRVRRGRLFLPADTALSPAVAVVNEAFARRYFPGEDPVGRSIVLDAPPGLVPPPPPGVPRAPRRTIVGVVADVKNARTMNVPVEPEVYAPLSQNVGEGWFNAMTLVVRTAGDPAALVPAVRSQVRALDPDQPVTRVATLEEILGRSLAEARFGMLLFALFAGAALLLAAVGVYGVVAYEARQRTHEIGIRSAIGAAPWSILRLVVGDGLKLALAGAAIGIAAAFGLMRLLASLLYGVGQYDPVTFLAMPAALVLAAGLAAYLPARRAMRVDPVVALRQE